MKYSSSSNSSSSSPPTSGNNIINNNNQSSQNNQRLLLEPVNRSSELLSCARSAVRIERRNNNNSSNNNNNSNNGQNQDGINDPSIKTPLLSPPPPLSSLTLYVPSSNQSSKNAANNSSSNNKSNNDSSSSDALIDALSLLSMMDGAISRLTPLVGRKGRADDPASYIESSRSTFEECGSELTEALGTIAKRSSSNTKGKMIGQNAKHYAIAAERVGEMAEGRWVKFKTLMAIRGEVLKERSLRGKELLLRNTNNNNDNKKGVAMYDKKKNMNGNSNMTKVLGGKPPSINMAPIRNQLGSPLFQRTTKSAIASEKVKTLNRNSNSFSSSSSSSIKTGHNVPSSSLSSSPTTILEPTSSTQNSFVKFY